MSRAVQRYSWNQFLPFGAAAATSSIEAVPMVERVKGIPKLAAALAPAISPSVCIILVKPVGAIDSGNALGPPSNVLEVSTCETSRRMFG